MADRKVDHKLKWGTSPRVVYKWGDKQQDIGSHFRHLEYKAMLNGGELCRAIISDPYRTIIGSSLESYFDKSRSEAPQKISFKLAWATTEDGPTYTQEQKMHVVSVEPVANSGHDMLFEIIAVDQASYNLVGGGASGEVFKGKIKDVLEKVINKYGRGVTPDIRSETQDDDNNYWYMYRLDPQTFILTLLEWSTKITKKKTEWFVYPDQDKIIIVQQADMQSKARATYDYGGFGADTSQPKDIMEHQMLADNILNMYRHQLVTSGISSVSGAYYDKIQDEDKNIVHVGDKQTSKKLKAKVGGSRGFKRPSPDDKPPDDFVGWTAMPSIPEHSAGDIGIRYDKYIDGYARNQYLRLNNMIMRCRFRVFGHYIWSGSEGLGVDTVKIIVKSKAGGDSQDPYYLSDNWIVYGYHHTATPGGWWTDLYCSKIDRDADAKSVGK